MNKSELANISAKAKLDKQEKNRLEKERADKEAADKLLKSQLYHLQETSSYIDKKIREAAEKGENSYQYDIGDVDKPELKLLVEFIYKNYAEFKPRVETRRGQRCINYDMGTYYDYSYHVFVFTW